MRVIMFQDRFASKVRDGSKPHTIRKTARCKPGDTLSLRRWTGKPYRSKQEVLREAVCTAVRAVTIFPCDATVDGQRVPGQHLAVCDGFHDWEEMRDWFESVHGLPFVGWLIEWSNAGVSIPGGEPGYAPRECSEISTVDGLIAAIHATDGNQAMVSGSFGPSGFVGNLIDPNAPRDLCGDSRITVHADVGMPGDPTSDVDPSVTPEQLRDALLTHCRTSRDQLREIEQANSLLDRNDPSNISQD